MTDADDEIRRAFVARATAAVDRLAAELPRRVIKEAMKDKGTKVG